MTVTKEHLVEAISNKVGYSKPECTKLVGSILEIIKKALGNGEDVLISGFGKFCVEHKNERRGRNRVTGEDVTLGARRVITFRCSSVLRKKINEK